MGGQSSGRRWARSYRFPKSAVYIIATSAGQHNSASTGPRPATNVFSRGLFVVSAVIRPARIIISFCAGPDRRSVPTALRYRGGPSARLSSGVLNPPVAHGSSPGESDAVLAKDNYPAAASPRISKPSDSPTTLRISLEPPPL